MQLHIETYKNRPTRAEISLPNLRNNFAVVRSIVAPGVKIMAVVKANAYGHGIHEISKELLASGADYLGVAYLEEALYLRRRGITAPILVMGAINTDQIAEFLENDIEITSSSYDKSAAISAAAVRAGKDALVHLKVDTGMERIGVHWYNAPAFIEKTFSLPRIRVTGIFSHFAKSESDPAFTKTQLERFDSVLDFCAHKGLTPGLVHIANSGGIINHPASHYSMVRPGIMLYGYNPNGHLPEVRFGERALRPVMSLKTKVAYFKVVPPDTGISYNHAYRTKEQTRIVTLPAGYGDGYSRLLTNRGEVVIRARRHPLVGTICMDQMMADIGPDGVAYNGDDALLFGEMDGVSIPLESLCGKIGTITYEVLCGISARVPRIYLQ